MTCQSQASPLSANNNNNNNSHLSEQHGPSRAAKEAVIVHPLPGRWIWPAAKELRQLWGCVTSPVPPREGHLQSVGQIPALTGVPGLQNRVYCPRMGYLGPKIGYTASDGVHGTQVGIHCPVCDAWPKNRVLEPRLGYMVPGWGIWCQDRVFSPKNKVHCPR